MENGWSRPTKVEAALAERLARAVRDDEGVELFRAGQERSIEREVGERTQILYSLLRSEGTAGVAAWSGEQSRYELLRIFYLTLSCHTQLVRISRGVWFVALCVVMLTFTNCMIATK
ncbi:MAG: hypothetical protein IM644_07525 [Phenylobacterium sp.]|uniref:hypothetical protein n=1 Tax=Phenylobacterium sp. TaxID=1871053 RepID=UPI0025ED6C7D|nr:hypothetical protein [Phenylobacterium sp.]MCA6232121.1 hypothetical protein [Phenylobacterium sp.]MCA6274975.1 hypothetical protein [Phenylobacterium sp.]